MANDAKDTKKSVWIFVLLTVIFILVILLSGYAFLYLAPRSTEEYYHRLIHKYSVSAAMEKAKSEARMSVIAARGGIAAFGAVDIFAAIGSFLCIKTAIKRKSVQ